MILGGKVINPGEFQTSVVLQTRSVSVETGGFQTEGWSTLATVWAKWTNAHGAEVWQAASLQAEKPATVLIRYQATLDTACAVLKGSDRYEIVSIDNISDKNEYQELKVRLWKAG